MTRKLNFTAIFEKILQNKQSNFTKSKFPHHKKPAHQEPAFPVFLEEKISMSSFRPSIAAIFSRAEMVISIFLPAHDLL